MMAPTRATVPIDALLAALRARLRPAASSPEDVDSVCLWLAQAELLGQSRFGVEMLLRDLDGRPDESAAARPPVAVSRTVARIVAAGTPGPLALASAARLAAARADEHGSAVIALADIGATGMLGLVARDLANRGLIAIVSAESAPVVAPWGGTAPAIGTNPIAVAVPRADAHPLVIDLATAPTTLAAIRSAAQAGAALPEGIAVDREGAATTDPSAVAGLLPRSRTDSLLGLIVELLAGVAVGGAATADRTEAHAPRGALVIAFLPPNPDAAAAATRLAEVWSAAGGHVPGRYDELPAALDGLPPTIELDTAALEALGLHGAPIRPQTTDRP